MHPHAFVVDHDETFLAELTFRLAQRGFKVTPMCAATQLMGSLARKLPDVAVLGRCSPDRDALALCRKVKRAYPGLPVILLIPSRFGLHGFNLLGDGPDDVVSKASSVPFILERIQGLCAPARAPIQKTMVREFGRLSIDELRKSVTLAGRRLTLTKSEYNILLFLARNQGRVVGRPTLLTQSLGYQGCTKSLEQNICFHVNRLRKKLGPCRQYIETVRGFGYRFSGRTSPSISF